VHRTARDQGAGVTAAHHDGRGADEAADRHWGEALRAAAIAELAEAVIAPAAHLAVVHQRTGMGIACGDLLHIGQRHQGLRTGPHTERPAATQQRHADRNAPHGATQLPRHRHRHTRFAPFAVHWLLLLKLFGCEHTAWRISAPTAECAKCIRVAVSADDLPEVSVAIKDHPRIRCHGSLPRAVQAVTRVAIGHADRWITTSGADRIENPAQWLATLPIHPHRPPPVCLLSVLKAPLRSPG
jgi:hypothetical protein